LIAFGTGLHAAQSVRRTTRATEALPSRAT
jgi:hypothetical protein